MTREEAARLLDPETTWYELWKHEEEMSLAACNEACRMGADALRAQQERENPKPLTLDELRQMNGEPVYIVFGDVSWWDIVVFCTDALVNLHIEGYMFPSTYGDTWLAYRHEPVEV